LVYRTEWCVFLKRPCCFVIPPPINLIPAHPSQPQQQKSAQFIGFNYLYRKEQKTQWEISWSIYSYAVLRRKCPKTTKATQRKPASMEPSQVAQVWTLLSNPWPF